jgi:CrcB protein
VLLAVALGGAGGTLLRVGVARAWPPGPNGFPWATLAVNYAGCFILGFALVAAFERVGPGRFFRPLIGTGFCGGLTTFSTFAVELDLLIKAGRLATAATYTAASLAGGLALGRLGMGLARVAWGEEAA